MKTGLQILEEIMLELSSNTKEKIVQYASFDYGCRDPQTTFVMTSEGVKCGQTTDSRLHGTKEVPVYAGSSSNRTLRWEEENGIALASIEQLSKFQSKYDAYGIEKLSESLPKIIKECEIDMDPENAILVTTSGYEDRGHYREGIYDWGRFLVPKKSVIEQIRKWDEQFTKELKPKSQYIITGGPAVYVFPITRGWRTADGSAVITDTHSFKIGEIDASNESFEDAMKIVNKIKDAIQKHDADFKVLFDNYTNLNQRIEEECQKKGNKKKLSRYMGVLLLHDE